MTNTLETLTASVHVLKIGNRKVTAAMAKQLDKVNPESVEPLGRIRLTGSQWELGFVHHRIVGKHRATGELVTAVVRSVQHSTLYEKYRSLPLIVL